MTGINFKELSCATLSLGAQGVREVGPFFGPAGHLGAVAASLGAKGVEKALCFQHCVDCDWVFLSPREWNFEYVKGAAALVKDGFLKEAKGALGGKAFNTAYHAGQLVLGVTELIARYADKSNCCKVDPNFSQKFDTPICEDLAKTLKKIEETMRSEQVGDAYANPIVTGQESHDPKPSLESLLAEEKSFKSQRVAS